MPRLFIVLAAAVVLAVVCGDDTDDSSPEPTDDTSTTSTTTTTTAPPPEPCAVIGDDGMPVVATGMTIDEMLGLLGPGWTSTPDVAFLVDVEGHHFDCDGQRRFYGAWGAGSAEVVDLVLSDHPDFVDPAGVGPGIPVTDAIALHGGSATVGINVEFEQREFIVFADGGTPDWQYQVRGPDFSRAGVYPEPLDGYVETSTFTDGAVIERIWWG